MPKIVILAGPNGAGKSTTAPLLLRGALAVEEFVNVDTLAAGLSAFASERQAFAAGRLALRRLHELAAARRDFAFETTLASRSFAPWLKALRKQGYWIELVYLWLPHAGLAIERVAERVRRGGHDVPKQVIRRRYEKNLANFFNLYTSLGDFWMMMDNTAPSNPTMVAWRYRKERPIVVAQETWKQLRARYEQA